ncbi:carbohydrate ABC transporter permease [Catenulispora yoronensis]|uniref:Carbohydrate ABC transporter permease n=2 Tax=Catenulispora yoronensis TaxID=450799 RepID=A0ABN2TRD2_9ACTN
MSTTRHPSVPPARVLGADVVVSGGDRPRIRRRTRRRLIEILLVVAALVYVGPFLFTLLASFRTAGDIAADPLGLPRHLTLDNYKTSVQEIHYFSSAWNAVLLTVFSCLAISVVGSMAAYPLARITSRLSTAMYRMFILGLTVPVFVIIGPLYLLIRDLHLLDSRFGLVVIYTALNLPVSVFFYTSFVRQIPAELEEAAAIDGCGPLRTFFTIIFPLMRPVTGTLLTFVSLQVWNNLVIPLVFLQDPGKSTVMANAYSFADPHTLQPTQLFPAALLGVLPLFVLFLIFQRQVVSGMTSGAVK